MLLGIGKDDLIERMWGQQSDIYEVIAALNFSLVTAINYSVWYDEPRLEHLVNLKRSLITLQRLQAVGVPVIPHVYWHNTLDLRRWANWLSQNEMRMIAINLQTAREETMWARLLEGIEWMGDNFPRHTQYLIIGPSTSARMSQIRRALGQVTFCNKDAYILATKRRRKTWDGQEFGRAHQDVDPSVLLGCNVGLINRVAEGNPPPAFTLLDGAKLKIMEQMTLPGVSTVGQKHSQQLQLVVA